MGRNSEVSERFMVIDVSFVVLAKDDKPGKSMYGVCSVK